MQWLSEVKRRETLLLRIDDESFHPSSFPTIEPSSPSAHAHADPPTESAVSGGTLAPRSASASNNLLPISHPASDALYTKASPPASGAQPPPPPPPLLQCAIVGSLGPQPRTLQRAPGGEAWTGGRAGVFARQH